VWLTAPILSCFAAYRASMGTKGATNLNRILRLTANLLFERGEDVPSVAKLLEGFVAPAMVRGWYERYCEVNGLEKPVNSKRRYKRMPMPPIDFESVTIARLQAMTDQQAAEKPSGDWP